MSISKLAPRVAGAVAVALLLVNLAYAQGGRGGFGGGFGGGLGRGGGGVDLLLQRDVQEELELIDDQVEDIRKIQEDMRGGMRERFAELRNVPREQIREKMQELMASMNADMEKKLAGVLLPPQLARFKQLQVQSEMRRGGGTSRSLTDGTLARELNITEDQKQAIEKAAEEASEELNKKIAQLRKEANEKIFAVLTSSQRKQLETLIGEPFEFQPPQFGRGPGGPGGPGDAGPGGRGGFGGRGRGGAGGPGGRAGRRPGGGNE